MGFSLSEMWGHMGVPARVVRPRTPGEPYLTRSRGG